MNQTYWEQVFNYITSIRVQTMIGCLALILLAPRLGLTPDQVADVRNVLIALVIGASLRPPGPTTVVPATRVVPTTAPTDTRSPYA